MTAFELFRRTYGALWLGALRASGQTTLQAAQHWAGVLEDCSPQEIAEAVGRWHEEAPPNVMALRKRILAARAASRPAIAAHLLYRALPVPRADPAVALRALAAARQALPEEAGAAPASVVDLGDPAERAERRARLAAQLRELGVDAGAGP